MKNPWMKFYPSDWRAEPALRMCSLAARGLWVEMIALMHDADPYGHLIVCGRAPTAAQLAVLVGTTVGDIQVLMAELDDAQVFSKTRAGVIYSRRMVRDEKKALAQSTVGKRGGNPALKGEYNERGYVYLMGHRSDGYTKIGVSVNPTNRLKKIRAQYRGDDIKIIGMWPVDDMGRSEQTLHEKFAKKSDGEWFLLSKQDIEYIGNFLDPKGSPSVDPLPQKPEARNQKPEARSQTIPPTPHANDQKQTQTQPSAVEIGLECLSICGADPTPWQMGSKSFSQVSGWLGAGYTTDEITAVFRANKDRLSGKDNPLAYAAKILPEAIEARRIAAQATEDRATNPADWQQVNGRPLKEWRFMYSQWVKDGFWPSHWGPAPNHPETSCPVSALAE